jgi:hypothetical protein
METILEVLGHLWVYILVAVILVVLEKVFHWGAMLVTSCFSRIAVYGDWETTLNRGKGATKHENAKLHQFIHRVWGSTTTKRGEKRTYRLRGRISGERLCLTYRQVGEAGFDCGAILLLISVEGGKMDGYEVGIHQRTNRIYSNAYKWTRKE